jgi:heat-inducible transcriptional repressor
MAKLEKMGYLYQPHTSAGRIPTDRGLRFYVNSLFEEAFLPSKSIDLPEGEFLYDKGNFNSLLIQASKLLSDHSDNLGFVISPKIMNINFHHLRLIKIAEEKILLILVSSFNLVLTEVVETKSYFTQDELDRAARYINENFNGKSLLFVRDFLMKEVPKYKLRVENLLHKLMHLLKTYFSKEGVEKQIFLQGASKLLEKPELFDMGKLQNLFHNFEEKAKLAKLLSDFISLNRVKVVIGSEMDLPEISDCSLILSHYGYDRQILGSLGIIGPKRIPYKKIIPLVDSVAKKLSQTISFER